MITYSHDFNTTFSSDSYKCFVEALDIHLLTCSCGATGLLQHHGHYVRYLKFPEGKVALTISRLICVHCRRTHAILPSFIVPYSQHSIADQVVIIRFGENGMTPFEIVQKLENPVIDEANAASIISRFNRFWQQRLLSRGASVFELLEKLVFLSFEAFGRQFLQIRRTPNVFFPSPT